MNKLFTISLFSFLTCTGINAQNNAAISACTNGTNVQISFDISLNCAAAPGSLSGMTDIGFHSGADNWSTVVTWDAATAVSATNNGSDVFTVEIDPSAYYGVAASTLHFVYNSGPADPANPWNSEGKDDDGSGGCQDFLVDIASLSPCATSINEVTIDDIVSVYPNPTSDITFFNVKLNESKIVNISLFDITGKLISNITNSTFSKGSQTIEFNSSKLHPGVYFYKIDTGNQSSVGKLIKE